MKEPLVSIVVPVYNTARYVEECIQSILSQTYKNVELVLVNDGSTDGSGDICKKYKTLSNVQYIEQENQGVTSARRRGVEESHGEWIMFVDSDDVMTNDAVRTFLSNADGVDIVVGSISENNIAYPELLNRDEYLLMMYAKRITSGPWAKLIRKKLFNEKTLCFDRKVCRWEDWLMNLQIAKDNQLQVKTVSADVYVYRVRCDSASHTYVLSYSELENLCGIADDIVLDGCTSSLSPAFLKAKMENRLKVFYLELLLNGFHNEPNHSFIKDIKRCMNEAGVWRPMDRLLLSVSSPWAVKMVWNLRRVLMRLEHPTMLKHDMKKLLNIVGK